VPEPPPLRDPERVSVVRGRIWLRSGASLEGSRVILWGGAFPGSPVDAEGRFEIRAPWEMATSCFLDRDGVRLLVMDQVLASFERDAVLEIEVDDGESIAIPVVDGGTGRPVAGARVALRGGQGQAGAVFGESDESGLFAASFLPAGEYTAEVTHPEFTPLTTRIDVPLPPARSSS